MIQRLVMVACCLAFAMSTRGETVVQIHSTVTDLGPFARPAFPPDAPSASRLPTKVERPSSFYIVPHYAVETTNPGGDTTLIAVRNEDAATQQVLMQYFPVDSLDSLIEESRMLAPKEVWTVNLRDVLAGIPADSSGYLRGWARILGSGGQSISADYFQASPSDAFAVGEVPIDIDGSELCERYKVRFLLGGGFSGGTVLTLMMDTPLGDDTSVDPPSVTGTVYDEAGAIINTFQIYTNDFSLQFNASALVLAGTNFGSMDLRFNNIDDGFSGGAASVTHDASGLFSVGLKGFCLDAVMTP